MKRRDIKPSLLLSAGVVVFGLFFAVGGWFIKPRYPDDATRTTGVVEWVADGYGRMGSNCRLQASYSVEGTQYRVIAPGENSYATAACKEEGEEVQVRYDPQNPARASVFLLGNHILGWVFLLIGSFIVVVGCVMGGSVAVRLLRHGVAPKTVHPPRHRKRNRRRRR